MIAFAINSIFVLIGLGLLLVVFFAVLAPLESLGWWAGWSGKRLSLRSLEHELADPALMEAAPEMAHYIIYLSGIGVASADGLAPDEDDFIKEMDRNLSGSRVITDVFPYSVTNNPLTGQRALTPIWRKIRDLQAKNPDSLLAMVSINIRNLMQVLVSADPRYGPIYSVGVAEEIARSLARHGYRLGSSKPVFLIGFSGGGQVSVGATPYLTAMIEAPVVVISIGGVISNDPGLRHVKHLVHFYGEKDPLQAVGQYLWPGRWSLFPQSYWNRAHALGLLELKSLGPMAHNAYGGYYDVPR